MKKLSTKELLRKIDEATDFEEKSIPIYNNHLAAAVQRSDFSPEAKKKIKKSLNTLAIESKGHVILLDLVKKIYLEKK